MIYKFFSVENTPYFIFAFGILLIILIIFLFIKQFAFERKITTKTINIITRIETDAVTDEECVKMTIANTGFHSIEIRGFGFKHGNRDYDYLRTYKDERNIPVSQKIVISPRDSLETIIDLNDLKAKLNTTKIGKFKAYVIDVYGNYTLIPAKDVKAFVELYFKHVEYIEKVRKMPAEKQAKCLAKEKMFEERKKKILNHTIEDSFDKTDMLKGEVDATNYAEEVKVIEPEKPAVEEAKEPETFYEPEVEENQEEPTSSSDFVFNFDDSFSNSFSDDEEEIKKDDEE